VLVKARVGPDDDRLSATGPVQPGEELVDEPHHAPGGVRRALPEPGMEHLAGVGPGGQQRVVAERAV
jgi:hypothetical protein